MYSRSIHFLCHLTLLTLTLVITARAQTVAPLFQQQLEIVPLTTLAGNPSQMAWGPDQRLYVMTNNGILSYAYNAQTGALSDMKIAVPNLSGIGIAFHGQNMYATTYTTTTSSIYKLNDSNGNGIWGETNAGEVNVPIVTGIPCGDHFVDQLQIQGKTLYVGMGRRTVNGRKGPLTSGILDDLGSYGFWAGGNGNTWGDCAYGGTIAWIQDMDSVPDTLGAANAYASTVQTQALIQNDDSPYTATDSSKLVVHSAGARNPFGLCFDNLGRLWFTNNFNRNATNGDGTSGFGYPEDQPGPDLSRSVFDQLFLASPGADYGYADDNWRGKNPMMTPGSPGYHRVLSTTFDNSFNNGPYTLYDPANPSKSTLKIACVGDSITLGTTATIPANTYPSDLGQMLGLRFQVSNFAVNGTTLLKDGDVPYWSTSGFSASAAYAPDAVVIMLGTNDSKPQNWVHQNEFAADYAALLDYYAALPSHPRLFVCLPPPVIGTNSIGIAEGPIEAEIPLIQQVAAQKGATVIDTHDGIPADPAYYVDSVHPNDAGYLDLASTVYQSLTNAQLNLPPGGLGPSSSADGCAFFYSANLPASLFGNIFIARYNNAITEVPNGGIPHTLNYSDVVAVDTATGIVQRVASGFNHPLALLSDGRDRLLVADYQIGSGGGAIYALHTLPNAQAPYVSMAATPATLTSDGTNLFATVTLQNKGSVSATGVQVTAAALNSNATNTNPLPVLVGDLVAGASQTVTLSFLGAGIPSGSASLQVNLAYSGQSSSSTVFVTTPFVNSPPANIPPTVSLTAPTASMTITKGVSTSLTAAAADSDGTVAQVAFYAGGRLIGTANANPYTVNWTPTVTSTVSLTATVSDNQGATTISAPVSVIVTSGSVTPPANVPPSVSITSPANSASVRTGTAVPITATASDSDGTVTSVAFYVGTALVGTATTAPYSVNWTPIVAGPYSLTAVATDNSGAATTSAPVSVTVTAPNVPPTVSLTAPINGASAIMGTTVSITAAASDSDGTITKIAFYAGTTLIGTATTSPYTVNWTPTTAGPYILTAVATDNSGATTTSTPVNITVTAPVVIPPANVPPTVSLTAPANGASAIIGTAISLNATANDSDGNVTKIAFYAGSTLIGTSTTSPYMVNWTTTLAGSYSLTAIATDNSGATTTSTPVSVTVTAPITGPTGNSPPSVSLSVVSGGTTVAVGTAIPLLATATDSDGTVAKVAFYINGTLFATGTNRPYTVNVRPGAGTYTFTVIATDNLGASTTSNPIVITVTNSPVSTPPANVPPTVSLTTPANGTSVTTGTAVSITATAADADGTVASVAFYAGTTLIGTVTTSPYTLNWTPSATGPISLTAVATDNKGATATSTIVSITATPPVVTPPANVPPTVSLTAPTNGATITKGASTSLTATAADSDGTVAKVAFYAGSTLIGTNTTSPYTVYWTPTTTGSVNLTAIATDNLGATTTSAPVNVTITAPNVPPTVSITTPTSGMSVTTGTAVSVSASAADSDGAIASAAFYINGTLVATTITSPYTINWMTTVAGTYTLTAVATDNKGATTTSAPVSVTVTAPVITPSGNNPPSVSLAVVSGGTTVAVGTAFSLLATATDSDGTVAKVGFYINGTLFATGTNRPYTVNVRPGAGTYTFTTIATDNKGAATTSNTVIITVH